MAYKIGSQTKAWWPIRFNGVTEEGVVVENEIRGRFRILDEDENVTLEADIVKVREALTADSPQLSGALAPIIERFLEDWQGVLEDDGTPEGKALPFTPENLKRMLRVPNFAAGVGLAFREVRAGEPERRRGN
jgi:hypothetical protein